MPNTRVRLLVLIGLDFHKPSRRHGQAPVLTKSQVLAELDVTLALKEQASNVNPYDNASRNQVNVLHQVWF